MAPPSPADDVTRLLLACSDGDAAAQTALFEQVYRQLHAMADRQMAQERDGHTLQPTALVHEVWLRLFGGQAPTPGGRSAFFATAARAMRQVLVDHARRRTRKKRGGGARQLPANALELVTRSEPDDVLAIDEALQQLRQHDAKSAEVVELRFFAGLEVTEVATLLGRSPRTVERDWAYARAWLFRHLRTE